MYEGYTNRQTYIVARALESDSDWVHHLTMLRRTSWQRAAKAENRSEAATDDLAQKLRRLLEHNHERLFGSRIRGLAFAGVFEQFAAEALEEVNWSELAANCLDSVDGYTRSLAC